MKYIPDSVIEDRAYNLLTKYSENYDWKISLPIPIEMIIEKQLGFSLDTFVAEENILGAIDQINKIIYTNENAMSYFNNLNLALGRNFVGYFANNKTPAFVR